MKLQMRDRIDCMHMSRITGRWRIVNMLWEMTPEEMQRYGIA